jgi:glycerol uptake facilitator-like aquaporin
MSGEPRISLSRRLAAEALGSLLLACVVIGSGILAEKLSAGNAGVALIGNTLATVAALGVLITIFGPLSGAHFNPAVSAMMALRRELAWSHCALYTLVQIAAMIAGAWLAHAMFGLPIIETSQKIRGTWGEALGEFVATFWLLLTIFGTLAKRPGAIAICVAAAITAGYWFTSSTSFANPAITIARSMSDTFAGVRPADIVMFVSAQLAGALAATTLSAWLFASRQDAPDTSS